MVSKVKQFEIKRIIKKNTQTKTIFQSPQIIKIQFANTIN